LKPPPPVRSPAFLTVLLLFSVGLAWPQASGSAGAESSQEERFDLEIPLIDGGFIAAEDLRGKILVVDVWGTWCGPCRTVIPSLIEIQRRFGDRGVEVIGVSAEVSGDYETAVRRIRQFAADLGMNYQLGILDQQIYARIREIMKFEDETFIVPSTFVVNREGFIIARYPGYFFGQEREILDLLSKRLTAETARSSAAR
jgi:thiol-disulfide isomerase/thioredoxin